MNDSMKSRNARIFRLFFYILWTMCWLAFYWKLCVLDNTGDYRVHNLIPEKMMNGETSLMNFYPLYHFAVLIISELFNCTTQFGSAVVLTLVADCTLAITERLCAEIQKSRGISLHPVALLGSAVLVNIVQPIFYTGMAPGYSSGNGYVSPTQAFVKPFTLLCCYIMWECLEYGWTWKRQILLGVVLTLSCFAKPMFAMTFIPAMGILLLFEVLSEKNQTLLYYFRKYCKKGLPLIVTGIVLIFQYAWSQHLQGELKVTTTIAFGWMIAWKRVVKNVWLSILFAYLGPFIFLVAHIKQLKFTSYWKMTALYGAISFLVISCLYQQGSFLKDMNFRNAWVVTFTLVYLGCFAEMGGLKKRHWAAIAPFCIHVFFGVLLIGKNILYRM